MKIEIWSDIMCPFCYIGKRHLEAALTRFPKLDVEIVWKSFQLDPTITPQPGKDVYTYLAERKGMSIEQSKEMHAQVIERAKEAGLNYQMDHAIIANSFDAHRLLQFAKTKGKGDALKELLLSAYFIEGKDFGDKETLEKLGVASGLALDDVHEVVYSTEYSDAVKSDIEEGQNLGLQGVPFFVFDRKYAISGAQPVGAFVETIQTIISNL